jgi:hypothetical protein
MNLVARGGTWVTVFVLMESSHALGIDHSRSSVNRFRSGSGRLARHMGKP